MRNLLFALVIGASVWGGDGPSNGGDPAQFQVYDRARFALEKIKSQKMLSPEHIAVLEETTKDLVVEPDRALPIMGEVKPDPTRGGKRIVYINPKLFLEEFDRRESSLDLTKWVVHEVLQTKINPATATANSPARAYDTDEEISRTLQFEEKEFDLWRKRQNPGFLAVAQKQNFKLIPGDYRSLRFNSPRITYNEGWEQYYFDSPRRRLDDDAISNTPASGPEKIALKAVYNANGQVSYVNADRVTYHHRGNWCEFEYSIEIRPVQGGIRVREKYPLRSWGSGGKGCDLYEDYWREHPSTLRLTGRFEYLAYEDWMDRAVTKEERAIAQLFRAVSLDSVDDLKAALLLQPDLRGKDWQDFTPLEYAAFRGQRNSVYTIAPLLKEPISSNVYHLAELLEDQDVPSSALYKDATVIFDMLNALLKLPSQPRGVSYAIKWIVDHRTKLDGKRNWKDLIEQAIELPTEGTANACVELLISHKKEEPNPNLRDLGLKLFKKGLATEHQFRVMANVINDGFDDYFWELIGHGFDIKAKQSGGWSYLSQAVASGRLDLAKRLVNEFGLDPMETDENGATALGISIVCAPQALVDWLLPLTDVNHIAGKLQEPVLVTVARNYYQYPTIPCEYGKRMQMLLDKKPGGAKPEGKNANGYTAIDYVTLLIKKMTKDYRHVPLQDPQYQYALGIYRYLSLTAKVPHAKVEAPPSWIINGGWHP